MNKIKFNTSIKDLSRLVHPDTNVSTELCDYLSYSIHTLIGKLVKKGVEFDIVKKRMGKILKGTVYEFTIKEADKTIKNIQETLPDALDIPVKCSAINGYKEASHLTINLLNVFHSIHDYNKDDITLRSLLYISSAIEYILTDMLELGGNYARDKKSHTIYTGHIRYIVANDEALNKSCDWLL